RDFSASSGIGPGGPGQQVPARDVCQPFPLPSPRIARQMRSGVAGIGTSVTPSGARASRMAFTTVGVEATVPPSPTPLAPNGFVVLGTGLKSTVTGGNVSARGIA